MFVIQIPTVSGTPPYFQYEKNCQTCCHRRRFFVWTFDFFLLEHRNAAVCDFTNCVHHVVERSLVATKKYKTLKQNQGADATRTPSYSSDLHLSVLIYRPDRGQLMCSKICSKKLLFDTINATFSNCMKFDVTLVFMGLVGVYVGRCSWPSCWSVWWMSVGLKRECSSQALYTNLTLSQLKCS